MTKGTQSFGRRHTKSHELCKRCGRTSMHKQKKECAACGYPNPKTRKYNWSFKAIRRKTTGTGSAAHIKSVKRKEANGWTQVKAAIKRKSAVLFAKKATA